MTDPEREPRSQSIAFYDVFPLLIAIAVLIVGTEVGHMSQATFWRALAIVFVATLALGGCVLVGLLAQRRTIASQFELRAKESENRQSSAVEEIRKSAFGALTSIALSSAEGRRIDVLSAEQVAAIELQSDEVWIYAYDLSWDSEATPLSRAVRQNLIERKPYRYLISGSEVAEDRTATFVSKLRDIPNLEDVLELRRRPNEVPFSKFAVTIYNPTSRRTLVDVDAVVVLLPHFSATTMDEAPLIRLKKPYTYDFEEEFNSMWRRSEPISIQEILKEYLDDRDTV